MHSPIVGPYVAVSIQHTFNRTPNCKARKAFSWWEALDSEHCDPCHIATRSCWGFQLQAAFHALRNSGTATFRWRGILVIDIVHPDQDQWADLLRFQGLALKSWSSALGPTYIHLVGGLEHVLFSHILGMSSSQLTNSYFSEG